MLTRTPVAMQVALPPPSPLASPPASAESGAASVVAGAVEARQTWQQWQMLRPMARQAMRLQALQLLLMIMLLLPLLLIAEVCPFKTGMSRGEEQEQELAGSQQLPPVNLSWKDRGRRTARRQAVQPAAAVPLRRAALAAPPLATPPQGRGATPARASRWLSP